MTAERCGYVLPDGQMCNFIEKNHGGIATMSHPFQPAAPPKERRRQHRVLAKSGLVLRDWHDVEPWCSQGECNVEEYRAAPPVAAVHDKCRWCDKDERDDHEHGDHVYMPMSIVNAMKPAAPPECRCSQHEALKDAFDKGFRAGMVAFAYTMNLIGATQKQEPS